jgi:hypothetical protein
MKTKTPIQAADLYVMLQREFRRRQLPECSVCYMQLPFRVDRPSDAESANWEVIYPTGCDFGCREVMDDVVDQFSRQYDLIPESSR